MNPRSLFELGGASASQTPGGPFRPVTIDPAWLQANDGTTNMVIPWRPIRYRVKGIPRFVTTRGGAYFFMPSLTALAWLANTWSKTSSSRRSFQAR